MKPPIYVRFDEWFAGREGITVFFTAFLTGLLVGLSPIRSWALYLNLIVLAAGFPIFPCFLARRWRAKNANRNVL